MSEKQSVLTSSDPKSTTLSGQTTKEAEVKSLPQGPTIKAPAKQKEHIMSTTGVRSYAVGKDEESLRKLTVNRNIIAKMGSGISAQQVNRNLSDPIGPEKMYCNSMAFKTETKEDTDRLVNPPTLTTQDKLQLSYAYGIYQMNENEIDPVDTPLDRVFIPFLKGRNSVPIYHQDSIIPVNDIIPSGLYGMKRRVVNQKIMDTKLRNIIN